MLVLFHLICFEYLNLYFFVLFTVIGFVQPDLYFFVQFPVIGFVYPDFDFFVLFRLVLYIQRLLFRSIWLHPRFVVLFVLLNILLIFSILFNRSLAVLFRVTLYVSVYSFYIELRSGRSRLFTIGRNTTFSDLSREEMGFLAMIWSHIPPVLCFINVSDPRSSRYIWACTICIYTDM